MLRPLLYLIMVVGYQCPEHGFHTECDVDESGERICPEGAPTAVTGITGTARRHTPGTTIGGDIEWNVVLGYSGRHITVAAFDVEGAFETAMNRLDDPHITEIIPTDPQERSI